MVKPFPIYPLIHPIFTGAGFNVLARCHWSSKPSFGKIIQNSRGKKAANLFFTIKHKLEMIKNVSRHLRTL